MAALTRSGGGSFVAQAVRTICKHLLGKHQQCRRLITYTSCAEDAAADIQGKHGDQDGHICLKPTPLRELAQHVTAGLAALEGD